MGAVTLWRERQHVAARLVLAAGVLAASAWSAALLSRSPGWLPWLVDTVIALGIAGAAGLFLAGRLGRVAAAAVITVSLAAMLAGSVAYSIDTALTPHTGAIPSAGPVVAGAFGPGGGGPGGGGRRGGPGAPFAGAFGPPAGGSFIRGGGGPGAGGPGAGGANPGGLLDASSPPAELVSALQRGASGYEWVAATVGANSAAGYQLATDDAVMAIGGFNGTDPTPTLSRFEQLVSAHRIHYFIAAGRGGFGGGPGAGGSGSSSSIASWVESQFTATTVGGITLYDLTAPLSGGAATAA